MLLSPSIAIAADAPMMFRVAKDSEVLPFRNAGYDLIVFGEGIIDDEVSNRAERFFNEIGASNALKKLILLKSPGGNLYQSMQFGRLLRRNRFDTALSGDCESACVSVYMGGVWRYYGYTQNRLEKHDLKVHRFFDSKGGDLGQVNTQIVAGDWIKFISEMGVDPLLFYLSAQYQETVEIPLDLAIYLRLANEGSGPIEQRTYIEKRKAVFEFSKSNWLGSVTVRAACDFNKPSQPLSMFAVVKYEKLRRQGGFNSIVPLDAEVTSGFFSITTADGPHPQSEGSVDLPVVRKFVGRHPEGGGFVQVEFGGDVQKEFARTMTNMTGLSIFLFTKEDGIFDLNQVQYIELGNHADDLATFANQCVNQ